MAAGRQLSDCLRDLSGARIGQCIRYEPAFGQRGARACFQAAAAGFGPFKPGFRPGTSILQKDNGVLAPIPPKWKVVQYAPNMKGRIDYESAQ